MKIPKFTNKKTVDIRIRGKFFSKMFSKLEEESKKNSSSKRSLANNEIISPVKIEFKNSIAVVIIELNLLNRPMKANKP
jgi:hypothetical protein